MHPILLILFLLLTILLLVFLHRNQKVFTERQKTRKVIFAKDKDNHFIHSHSEVTRMLDYVESIATYNEAVLHLWIPVTKIYTDFYQKHNEGYFKDVPQCNKKS